MRETNGRGPRGFRPMSRRDASSLAAFAHTAEQRARDALEALRARDRAAYDRLLGNLRD